MEEELDKIAKLSKNLQSLQSRYFLLSTISLEILKGVLEKKIPGDKEKELKDRGENLSGELGKIMKSMTGELMKGNVGGIETKDIEEKINFYKEEVESYLGKEIIPLDGIEISKAIQSIFPANILNDSQE